MRTIVGAIEGEYRRYKKLGDGAMAQLDETQIGRSAAEYDNSIAVIVWHISGNLKSRFADFLHSDGEKPWRARDEEFVARTVTKAELLKKWEEGWSVLLNTLSALTDDDLHRQVTIR